MIYAGIDYSMTSPALCCFVGEEFSIDGCKFYYVTTREKLRGKFLDGKISGMMLSEYNNDIDRFDLLSEMIVDRMNMFQWANGHKRITIGLEDYAMGAKGRVFAIGENTGILKYNLRGYPLHTYPPTVIKKFATGKGNANKELMYEKFTEETNLDLKEVFPSKSEKIGNPISDIIDSYYICKMHYNENQ